MGFEVRMTGKADLYAVRKALQKVGDTGLGKQMDRAFKAAVRPLEPAIQSEIPRAMPSGYAPVLSRSLQTRLSSKTAKETTELRYRVYADGKTERRDVPSLNRGRLRHPVYGRRRKPWVNQRVRSGFVDRPVDRLLPNIRREMNAVTDYVADAITKG